MISKLKYQTEFQTGRELSADLEFGKGLTAITGANEVGKSMIMEVIRWTLFGTDALRGSAKDYVSLKSTMEFSVRGKSYVVKRSLSNAHLYSDDKLLCSGTRPVTARIMDTLGFDLAVFDIACAANQNSLDALSRMRPADRKRMVDKVIGADRIEEIAKWAGEESLNIKRLFEMVEKDLREPVKPIKPDGYTKAAGLRDVIEILKDRQGEYYKKIGWLSNKMSEPEKPKSLTIPYSLEQLQAAEILLQMQVYDFNVMDIADAWGQYDLYLERQEFMHQHPTPVIWSDQIEIGHERLNLTAELDRLRKSPVIHCPCGKPFTTADMRIAEIEKRLEELGTDPDNRTKRDLDRQEQMVRDWESPRTLDEWDRVKVAKECQAPSITKRQLEATNRDDAISKVEFDARMKMTGLTSDLNLVQVRKMIGMLNEHTAALAGYEPAKTEYEKWLTKAAQVALELDEIREEIEDLPALESRLVISMGYEKELELYNVLLDVYSKRKEEVDLIKQEKDSWQEVKTILGEIRQEIKTHLVPSLSKHASILMGHMTGGSRNSIVVSDDFEVQVDGQPLSTLSGSGQACANLALRIGLGQVLTNGVFSLFMGDELDASMDDERAANLQTSLVMLKDYISQIIIITHKLPKADKVIHLKPGV